MNADTDTIHAHLGTIRRGVMDYAAMNGYVSDAEKAARALVGDAAFAEVAEARKALPKRADDEAGFVAGHEVVKAAMLALAEEAAR